MGPSSSAPPRPAARADDRAPGGKTGNPRAPRERPCRQKPRASRSARWPRPAAGPASRKPIWLSANTQLSAMLQDWRGYQREMSTTADMKLPAQPSPTTKRAAARPAPDSATECSSAPATISTDRADTVMRGPILSNRTPTKICGSSSARKKLPLANPSASGESDRSRMSSGAMTDVEARKNCDRMVVAASIASRTAAAFHAIGGAGAAAFADCAGGFSFTATALPSDYLRQVSRTRPESRLSTHCDVHLNSLHAGGPRVSQRAANASRSPM